MIKIPFNPCIILSTLTFEQITDRLVAAIYDPQVPVTTDANQLPKQQCYHGRVGGFRFLATRIIGYKHIHLPTFLVPTIEGEITALPYGYEISLGVRMQNITFALCLAWLGGILTTSSVLLDRVFANIHDDQYFKNVEIAILLFLLAIGYFYFTSWRTTRFFRNLFAQRLTGIDKNQVVQQSRSIIDRRKVLDRRSATDWMRVNLPSFPSTPTASQTRMKEQESIDHQPRSVEDLMRVNLPYFPSAPKICMTEIDESHESEL
jgi:hypothetical protein